MKPTTANPKAEMIKRSQRVCGVSVNVSAQALWVMKRDLPSYSRSAFRAAGVVPLQDKHSVLHRPPALFGSHTPSPLYSSHLGLKPEV